MTTIANITCILVDGVTTVVHHYHRVISTFEDIYDIDVCNIGNVVFFDHTIEVVINRTLLHPDTVNDRVNMAIEFGVPSIEVEITFFINDAECSDLDPTESELPEIHFEEPIIIDSDFESESDLEVKQSDYESEIDGVDHQDSDWWSDSEVEAESDSDSEMEIDPYSDNADSDQDVQLEISTPSTINRETEIIPPEIAPKTNDYIAAFTNDLCEAFRATQGMKNIHDRISYWRQMHLTAESVMGKVQTIPSKRWSWVLFCMLLANNTLKDWFTKNEYDQLVKTYKNDDKVTIVSALINFTRFNPRDFDTTGGHSWRHWSGVAHLKQFGNTYYLFDCGIKL